MIAPAPCVLSGPDDFASGAAEGSPGKNSRGVVAMPWPLAEAGAAGGAGRRGEPAEAASRHPEQRHLPGVVSGSASKRQREP